jgi:glycosyltransferase involved in cell wall biosynthesis
VFSGKGNDDQESWAKLSLCMDDCIPVCHFSSSLRCGRWVMTTLAATVITKNESKQIRHCLESVNWVDEIIVLDSGSTDDTVAICREYTDKVFVTDWPGFGVQKNRAVEKASCEWILSIDADEFVSEALRREIEEVIDQPNNRVAYQMPRRSSYCGRFMRHSGWWPDHITRLFRRGYARFSDDLVHERLVVQGAMGRLTNPMIHRAFSDLEEVLETANVYSSVGARMLHQQQKKASLMGAVLHGLWSFFHTYILRTGFLDGKKGFMLAVSNGEGTYYKYLKLMLLGEMK